MLLILIRHRAGHTASLTRKLSTNLNNVARQQQERATTGVFQENAAKWWNGKEFELLRAMNEIRVPFIKRGLIEKKKSVSEINDAKFPLKRFKIIDVGCGGGILSEPLARLGACVLGIDPVHESIVESQRHAKLDEIVNSNLKYRNCGIEDLISSDGGNHQESYDAVVASEVLEHIRDIEGFLKNCTRVLKPNGSLFITTINQTPLAYLGVILFGEYILRQLPRGTHSYDMFVNLTGLKIMLERMGYQLRLINGFMYEPLTGQFLWTPFTQTHYAIHAIKSSSGQSSGSSDAKSWTGQYEQKRTFSTTNLVSGKTRNKTGPRVKLTDEDMLQVVELDEFRAKCESVLIKLKEMKNL